MYEACKELNNSPNYVDLAVAGSSNEHCEIRNKDENALESCSDLCNFNLNVD